jgi:hypothetical protein
MVGGGGGLLSLEPRRAASSACSSAVQLQQLWMAPVSLCLVCHDVCARCWEGRGCQWNHPELLRSGPGHKGPWPPAAALDGSGAYCLLCHTVPGVSYGMFVGAGVLIQCLHVGGLAWGGGQWGEVGWGGGVGGSDGGCCHWKRPELLLVVHVPQSCCMSAQDLSDPGHLQQPWWLPCVCAWCFLT